MSTSPLPPELENLATTAAELYNDMSSRARRLLAEIAAFQEYIFKKNGADGSSTLDASNDSHASVSAANRVFTSKFQREVERDVAVLDRHGLDISARSGQSGSTRETLNGAKRHRTGTHNREAELAQGNGKGQEKKRQAEIDEHDEDDLLEQNLMHKIRSSNVSFHEAIWAKAKRSKGVVAFRKKVKFLPMELMEIPLPRSQQMKNGSSKLQQPTETDTVKVRQSKRYTPLTAMKASGFKPKSIRRDHKETIIVDVIADDGSTWVKVATTSEKRLLMDLAKEGIVNYSSDEEQETDDSEVDERVHKDYAELKLIKTAAEYMAAARTARIRYQHPRVVMYLPHVREGHVPDIDKVLKELRKTGVEVETADVYSGQADSNPPETITTTFDRMLVTPIPRTLTDTVNMDCTALIALVSDISHCARDTVQVPSHYEQDGLDDIENQFQADVTSPLLPRDIYPLLVGRKLVCTAKTASHLHNIVKIMGSEREKERARLFLSTSLSDDTSGLHRASNPETTLDDEQAATSRRREALQNLSMHPLPASLRLPIQIVEFDLEPILHPSPVSNASNPAATTISESQNSIDPRHRVIQLLSHNPKLSGLNRSVFFHGWLESITTISLNRVFSEWIEREINFALNVLEQRGELEGGIDEGFEGPDIVVSGRERSLLGSEKGGKG